MWYSELLGEHYGNAMPPSLTMLLLTVLLVSGLTIGGQVASERVCKDGICTEANTTSEVANINTTSPTPDTRPPDGSKNSTNQTVPENPPPITAQHSQDTMIPTTTEAMMDGSTLAAITSSPSADVETNPTRNNTSGSSRAINFPLDDGANVGHMTATNMSEPEKGSLQDLSLDDIDVSSFMSTSSKPMLNASVAATGQNASAAAVNASSGVTHSFEDPTTPVIGHVTVSNNSCVDGAASYRVGERFYKGCEATCVCEFGGDVACKPRCSGPMFRRGKDHGDPACTEKPVDDPCCAILVCTHDTETEPIEGCSYKNQTYQRGELINDGCEAVCSCGQAGKVTCKPRCPVPANNASDRCVPLPDPADPCCTVILCDVTLGDHDVNKAGGTEENVTPHLQLLTAEAVNTSAVQLGLSGEAMGNITVESSVDQQSWVRQKSKGLLVTGLKPGKTYYLRVSAEGMVTNTVEVLLPSTDDTDVAKTQSGNGCIFKGRTYKMNQEFHDACDAYCACTPTGVQCATIECPTEFGLDVLDPHCVDWEMSPPGFVASPPNCCPEKVTCKDNGSCTYEGERFNNWDEIPTSVSGCEKRCYCEFGNVTCQPTCPPVTASPPADLQCPPNQAILNHLPGDDCCLYWLCPQIQQIGFNEGHFPPGFPQHPGLHPGQQPDEVTVQTLEAVDENTIRLVFSVPAVLVGLHGRVELRYTPDRQNNDPSTWEQQVLAPPNDLIATPQLEFELSGLQPDTMYKIKVTVILKDLQNSPSSQVMTVKTLPRALPTTTLPPQIPVDAQLTVGEVNVTWIRVVWRKFSEFELQFIDGVQLRYKEIDGKVYAATPLIHRAVTGYTLEGLKPSTQYEIGIFFIPFPGQNTELQADKTVQASTAEEHDLYKFEVRLDVHHIKTSSVELSWSGVPYPEDKFVNIFRVIYQSDSGKEDFSNFKVAKRDAQPNTLIKDLKPGTSYRLWLEVYLTNGKIKKSNVQDFMTKAGSVPIGATQQGKLESAPAPLAEPNDYYGPLVAVAIIAALAIVASLILVLILMRKHGQNKAAISATRKTQSAYDNPSYKTCEGNEPASANGNSATNKAAATPTAEQA